MAQTQAGGGPSDPDATGGSMPDSPELWGSNSLVGDGRYRLTHRLGRGGMAEVFAAEDLRLGRTVAVKLLRPDLAEDPVSKARFTREAQSVAGLNHHAVVAVYDSGEEQINGNVTPYIVMELVEGSTIRDLLHTAEAPPPEQALIIVSGVLEALAYSHQHGIVHRDIKPANVIITDTGAVKVMDFGIARALHGASSTMTQTGMVMGTPQYLSPEQALGKTVDTRSDLYATGCLLYELLALRPPFTGETPLSVVYQHVQDDPVPPSQVLETVPPELDGLVMRALAKDPDDRFQTAEEMRGLAQYALQMLHDQGGFTGGLWDTGPVAHGGGATPAMGLPGAGARPHPYGGYGTDTPRHGETSQLAPPLLMGRPDGDYRGGPHGGGGRGGLKWAFVALLAVVVIAAGIYYVVNMGDGGGATDVKPTPSRTAHHEHRSTDDPPAEPTENDEDTGVGTGNSQGDWSPSDAPSQPTPSDDAPTHQSDRPTDTPSHTGGGTQTGGNHTGGGNGGQSKPPTDDPTPPGEGEIGGQIGGEDDGGAGSGGGGGNGGSGSE